MGDENKEKLKYKFGRSEIDLDTYIRNLGNNVTSYLNSKNWSEGLKQEFKNSYYKYIKGLEDLLQNNTNRFTTDDFGSIIDSTGELSDIDDDNIDSNGSEYYYDNKGNHITTNDFNALTKRKLKKYNTFLANREVASYFDIIGNALRNAKSSNNEKIQNNTFDLSKHGFLADWTTANNPTGGDFNWNPYLEKDIIDETTGKRGTSNRATYLKKLIENYINNIGEYDFSSSPFKNKDTYISKLRAAALNLENGYNSEDVIALNLAGIGNEFLNKFFTTEVEETPIEKSELELQAELSVLELKKMLKEDEQRAKIKTYEEYKYNRERDAYFDDYLRLHPFLSSVLRTTLVPMYDKEYMNDRAVNKFKVDKTNRASIQHAIKSFINLPQFYYALRNNQLFRRNGQYITEAHIANNLDWMYLNDILKDPKYLDDQGQSILPDGYYVLPGSEDYQNWSFLAYNPATRLYLELSMLLNEKVKKRMAYPEYDKKNKANQNTPKLENGGVLRFQGGGRFLDQYIKKNLEKIQKEAEKQQHIAEKVKETGKTRELVEAAERRTAEEGFSTIDKVRLGTAATDAAAAAAAFIPGYGTVASGVLGIGSTLTNIGADIADKSMSGWDVAGNALYGLVMDGVGLIPGLGTTGKAAKIVKVLKPVSKLAMRTLLTYGMFQSADAFNKLMTNTSDMSVDDWRNLVTGLQAISGEVKYRGGKRAVNRATTQRDVADVKTSTGRVATISKEDLDKLRKIKGLKALNKLFSELTGGQLLLREFKDREINWKKPWKSKLSSDSPEVSLRTKSSFLPEDNSWDAKLFREMNRDTSKKRQQLKILRQLSSQTGKLTPQEIATINKLRVKSGKGKLTELEILTLNQRRLNRAGDGTDNSLQARLLRYKDAKKKRKFTSLEDDIKLYKDEMAKAEARLKAKIAVDKNADNVRLQQLRELVAKILLKQIPTIPSAPLSGEAYADKEKFYNILFRGDKYYPTLKRKDGGILDRIRKFKKGSKTQILQKPNETNKLNELLFNNIINNPTITYGLPRAIYADKINKQITDLAKESVVPLLKDPFEIHRYTRSDLDAEMQGERNYANLRKIANNPFTSDGNLQIATLLLAELYGQEAKIAGKEKSNLVQRLYDELAWGQEKENAANRHETAMFNRALLLEINKIKNAFDQAYLTKKFNIHDVFNQLLEYEAKIKQKELEALNNKFIISDIGNSVKYNPNEYGAGLTKEELVIWNKVLSGTSVSELNAQELNSYKLAMQKINKAENSQLKSYYNIKNNWSNWNINTNWTPKISFDKNGAKIAVAEIKAKTKDAERFLKQIKECIDKNDKLIDKFFKILYKK